MTLRIGNKQYLKLRVPRSSQKGLTLIEVLLAVSILAIGIVGVLSGFASSITTLEASQYNVDSVNLLKEKIADIEQMFIEEPESTASSENGKLTEGPLKDFLWQWDIQSTETEFLNELSLIVSHDYNPRKFSIKTYVVDPKEEEDEE